MKKKLISLLYSVFGLILIGTGLSCESDFTSVGSGLVGDNNFETNRAVYPVITYNRDLGPIQSNGLPAYFVGYNTDPLYGDFTASFVSQVEPTAYNPTFGENVELDSVVLTIPYFSRLTETDEEGNSFFELDSIFGNSPIKLSVFRSNYFLRDFNPQEELDEQLVYFNNKTTADGNTIDPADLEGELLYEDDMFLPSADQIVLTEFSEITEEDEITARIIPSIRVKLNNPNGDFWQTTILEKEGEPELSNQSNWLDYFRGIYIKAEAIGPDGTLMLFRFDNNAQLSLYYTSETEDNGEEGDSEVTTEAGIFTMTFQGTQVNFIDTNFIDIPDGDEENGDERLYLKGSQGSMAVINLFNGDDDILQDFKNQNWLINQAQLIFYVDQDMVQGEEPDRVYLYDLANNAPLRDYFLDQSASAAQITGKIDHLKPLERVDDDPDGAGIRYKIEITEHINNILERDSTNVKLGLVVTTNVNAIDALSLLNDDDNIEQTVSGNLLTHRGTVLFGNNAADPEKRVELEIYYTEPDN